MLRKMLVAGSIVLVCGVGVWWYLRSSHGTQPPVTPRQVAEAPVPPPAPMPAPAPVAQTPPPAVEQPFAPVVVTPAPVPVPEPATAHAAPHEARRTHVVQRGDTLSSLSKKYYGSARHWERIAQANGLHAHDILHVGQVLVLPDAAVRVAVKEPPDANCEEPARVVTQTPPAPAFEPQPPTLNAVQEKTK